MTTTPNTMAAFLVQPDAALRDSFLEAMAEHEAADGSPDADGLSLADLRTGDCVDCYTQGLREGTALRPGTEPLLSTVWWYVTETETGREYLGRVSVRHNPATATLGERGSQVWVTVRPSRRRQGLGQDLLQAALPFAQSNGITEAAIEIAGGNEAARRLVEAAGAQLVHYAGAELKGRRRYLLATAGR